MKNSPLLFLTLFMSFFGFSQTSYTDIAPVLYKNCTSCHRAGGGAPFSMLTYNETVPWSNSMLLALQHGDMPPWGADTSYMHFVNERPISQTDKDAILAWIYDGSIEGDTALLPSPPLYPQYLLNGTPDTIVQMTPFYSNAGATDAYNIMVVPLALSQSRFVRAIEIVPSDPTLIHHSLVTSDTLGDIAIDTSGSSFTVKGQIPIGTYAPGTRPVVFPNSTQLKMGIEIPANGEIAMQIHTPAGTQGQLIDIQLRLYFYPINEPGIRKVHGFVPLEYWGSDFWIGPGQVKSFSVEEPTLPNDISIFSSFPHSHQICTEILNYAYNPLNSDTVPLIKIDKWDFEHQEYYYYKNLVKVPTGYLFHADHTYDNTAQNHHNPNSPPQLITGGFYTDDEMLFDGFQYIDYEPGDGSLNIDSILRADPLLITSSLGINESKFEFKSYVYPNPMVDRSFINFTTQLKDWQSFKLEVVNMKGQKVEMNSKLGEGYFEIHKGSLSAGVYFYQILDKNQKVSSGKIIVD